MVRQRSAKSLYGGSIPPQASKNNGNLDEFLLVCFYAGVAKLVDVLALGASEVTHGGSSPLPGTFFILCHTKKLPLKLYISVS